jgi:ribosomal protein S12 methylthiotransferase accessory factor
MPTMDMTFTLPGASRVEAHAAGFTIMTDQPPDATAPTPFMLFLASIGACAAYYVQAFCRQRGIPVDGIRVLQRSEPGPTGLVDRIGLTIELPPEFPERYRAAVIRAAGQCSVKKHLERPPEIAIETVVLAPA